ncbi:MULTISPECIES: HAD domain-containing protein [Dactylosporangium]|uniref:Uncharacterized protein n=1 Tax=Dactylosporangium matsuzakiense TaxID=53360 RepID=A0A9W6KFH4_9ACTN|nr:MULTISPECIES: HAD domain-containing protein [Dactylosporangium]UWZ42101.1 hypothetical protein Dmats_31495 [Dactylosporangium matsuzakiense]GLK99729.1 hypothetical protein GCM10017581_014700 [Dactylosporangium matsuzakiense]
MWLLDVDGVINVKRPGWGAAPFHDRAYALGAQWRLRWAPALIARIKRLQRDGVAEVRWCSTWCAWPDEVERVFKLKLDRAFGEVPDYSVAKLAAARAVLRGGRRLVWTDDVEVPQAGPLFDELTRDDRALLIRPDDRRGLTPAHLDAIEDFCKRL